MKKKRNGRVREKKIFISTSDSEHMCKELLESYAHMNHKANKMRDLNVETRKIEPTRNRQERIENEYLVDFHLTIYT